MKRKTEKSVLSNYIKRSNKSDTNKTQQEKEKQIRSNQ